MTSNTNTQPTLAGRIPSQQQMTQLLTQVEFQPTQLPATGDFNDTSQIDDNRRRNHNVRPVTLDNGDNDLILLKSKFDHAVQVYKFMHENKAEAGKRLSGDMRQKKFKEILDLYHNLKLSTDPIANYLINNRDIKWTTFMADERFWKLWDEKEEIIRQDECNRRGRRSRSRRREYDDESRSRSRSRERNNRINRNTNKSQKEQVSMIYGSFPPPPLYHLLLILFVHIQCVQSCKLFKVCPN